MNSNFDLGVVVIAKTRGRRFRTRNVSTGAWSGWQTVPVSLAKSARPGKVNAGTVSLDTLTRDALRVRCKAEGIRGYGKLSKPGIVALLAANGVTA